MDCSSGSRRETMLRLNQTIEGQRRVLSTTTSPDPGAAGDAGSGVRCAEGMDDSSLEEEEENPIPPQHRPKWCRAQPYRRTTPERADDMPGIWAFKDRSRRYMYQRDAIDEQQTARSLPAEIPYGHDLSRFQINREGLDNDVAPIPRYTFENGTRATKSGSRRQLFQPGLPPSYYNCTNGFEGNPVSLLSGNIPTVLQENSLQDIGISCEGNSVPNINGIISNSGVMCQSKVMPSRFSGIENIYKAPQSFERLSPIDSLKCRSEDMKQETPLAMSSPYNLLSQRLDAFSKDKSDATLLNLFTLDSLKACEDRKLFKFHPELLLSNDPNFNNLHIRKNNMTSEAPSLEHSRLTTAYGIPLPEPRSQPNQNSNVFQTVPLASSFGGYPTTKWTPLPGEVVKKVKADNTEVSLPEMSATPSSVAVMQTRNETPPTLQESGFLFTPNDFPKLPAPSPHSGSWEEDQTVAEPANAAPQASPPGPYSPGAMSVPMDNMQVTRLDLLGQTQSTHTLEMPERDLSQQHRVVSPLRWYNPMYSRYKFVPVMRQRIHNNILPTLQDDAYLSVFYVHTGLYSQLEAADHLYMIGWRYHKLVRMWMRKVTANSRDGCLLLENNNYAATNLEFPFYVAFDPQKWQEVGPLYNVDERYFEERPVLPDH